MSIRNLDKIFNPRHVAVIGADDSPASVGYMVFRNLIASDFRGAVYPVDPGKAVQGMVQGIPAFARIADLPEVVDLAVICGPAATVPHAVRSCGEKGVRGIIVLSAGFQEAGPIGRELEEALRREQARFDGMRIVGPNCLGVIVPRLHLNASLLP